METCSELLIRVSRLIPFSENSDEYFTTFFPNSVRRAIEIESWSIGTYRGCMPDDPA